MEWAWLRGQPRHEYAGFVHGAVLTREILAYFAVDSISFFFFLFEKTPFLLFKYHLNALESGGVRAASLHTHPLSSSSY